MTFPPNQKIKLSTDNATEVKFTVTLIDIEENKRLLTEVLHFNIQVSILWLLPVTLLKPRFIKIFLKWLRNIKLFSHYTVIIL